MKESNLQRPRLCHACHVFITTDAKGIHAHWLECVKKEKYERIEAMAEAAQVPASLALDN